MFPIKISDANVINSLGNNLPTIFNNLKLNNYSAYTLGSDIPDLSDDFKDCYFALSDREYIDKNICGRLKPQTDISTKIALCAVKEIIDINSLDFNRTGIVTATDFGGFLFGQNELQNLYRNGSEYVSAYQSFAWFYAVNTGQISIDNKIKGTGAAIVGDLPGGIAALLTGSLILSDDDDIESILVGATDSFMSPLALSSVDHKNILKKDDLSNANNQKLDKYYLGEGSSFLKINKDVIKSGDIAIKSISLKQSITEEIFSESIIEIIKECLENSKMNESSIDAIFISDSNHKVIRDAEIRALDAVFGNNWINIAISSRPKTGNFGPASVLQDLAFAYYAIKNNETIPVLSGEKQIKLINALILSSGIDGQLAAVVIEKY